MGELLKTEIKQTKPFASVEEEAFLNLVRTANDLWQELGGMLRRRKLTPTQYNVLRILRGAGEEGLPCGEVGARMVTREPDVTRLLDRLEHRGLVSRRRSATDRRVVEARITDAGLELLAALDEPVDVFTVRQLGHLGPARLGVLIELLEAVRER
ncbi:MAG TPA: MarR family transcriptional regulator [Thermoanaerobaculia bacterium]|jgi:DNA-binding MarR family transcriptional regulator